MKITPLLVLGALVVACAKQEPPPGTRTDRIPPQAVETYPVHGEAVPGFDGDAWIQFDEPLMDPRSVERTLLSSPAGRYKVTPGRTRIRVRPEDGWRDGIVYYFAFPSGLADLLRNRTTAPIELVFSPGTEVPPTRVQGHAYDRVTARGTRGVRLLFLSPDSVPYTAVSDTGGVFRLPGLPYGKYQAIAFLDQNRDFQYDAEFEPGDVVSFELTDSLTTASVDLWLLPADSTPPILASAEVLDSVTMRITFDDPLDPEAPLEDVDISIQEEPGDRIWSVSDLVVGRPVVAVVAADSTDAPVPVEVPAVAGPSRVPASSFVTVTVAQPFMEGTYRIRVNGLLNLRGLAGGGDTTTVYAPPPLPEPTVGSEGEGAADQSGDTP
jgi:hypothetical protein